jgi:hypothetical protein
MSEQLSMGTHPDIVTLRARYETASETAAGQIVGGTTFLAGLYLAISPWVVGFDGRLPLLFNNLIVGAAVVLLGLGLTAAFDRAHRLAWTVPVVAVWTIVSPWVVRSGDLRTMDNEWNNVLTGALLLLLGIATFMMAIGRSGNSLMDDTTRRRWGRG